MLQLRNQSVSLEISTAYDISMKEGTANTKPRIHKILIFSFKVKIYGRSLLKIMNTLGLVCLANKVNSTEFCSIQVGR